MYTKICPVCNSKFEAANPRYKYCSVDCRKAVEKEYQREKNRIYYNSTIGKAVHKRYYKLHYKPVDKCCQGCGTKLEDGRQSWCLDCLLQDYIKGSVKAIHRLNSRGFDKAMILEEIDFRGITI